MLHLTRQPQLFLDDRLLARTQNVRRRLQQPVKHPDNPLIVQKHPWERRSVQCYGNVLRDPETGWFRMWYFAAEQRDPDDVPWLASQDQARTNAGVAKPKKLYNTCYAESPDGVRWHKPMLNAVCTPLYSAHNILIQDTHSMCVLHEPQDPDPSRRYKAAGGRKLGFSPDGIHWRTRAWHAVGKNDTGTSVVWWQGRYLAYVRQQESCLPDWPLVRAVGLSESEHFEEWTPKRTVLQTDKGDGYPWTQPYGMTVFPCGDVLVGLLWMIVLDRFADPEHGGRWNNRVGDVRTEVVTSRDGVTWERVAGRAPFLEPGPAAWEQARVYPGTSVLEHDDRLWFYFTGTEHRHGEGTGRSGIGLATLPAERLVGLSPADPGEPGIVETPPLRLEAGDLVVNADLGAGPLQVGLLDSAGSPIPGFELDRSRLVQVDALRHMVRWGEQGVRKAPLEEPLVLRLVLHGAELFALSVRCTPT